MAPRANRKREEQDAQIAMVKWADLAALPLNKSLTPFWPAALRLSKVGAHLHHVPNGGARSKAEAGILKGMGVRAGVSDLCFALPVVVPGGRVIAGLWVEVKADEGKTTDDQEAFHVRVESSGYETSIVRNLDEFISVVGIYLRDALPLLHLVPPGVVASVPPEYLWRPPCLNTSGMT